MNALDLKTRQEMLRALEDAEKDPFVRVVAITGAGEKAFSAGADLKQMLEMSSDDIRNLALFSRRVSGFIREMSKPVIAAVNGLALGGGFELALACDMIIASENARFGLPEIRVGLIPGGGGTQRLTELIGEKKAKELILTGRMIDAKEAERLGVVNKVVPPDKLREEVVALANEIIEKSPIIVKYAKAAITRPVDAHMLSGLNHELELISLCFATEDNKEGIRAFLEKRKPVYKGK